jgi:hypothetical protein
MNFKLFIGLTTKNGVELNPRMTADTVERRILNWGADVRDWSLARGAWANTEGHVYKERTLVVTVDAEIGALGLILHDLCDLLEQEAIVVATYDTKANRRALAPFKPQTMRSVIPAGGESDHERLEIQREIEKMALSSLGGYTVRGYSLILAGDDAKLTEAIKEMDEAGLVARVCLDWDMYISTLYVDADIDDFLGKACDTAAIIEAKA